MPVTAIFIADRKKEPLRSIASAHIVPEKGIEGDRYFIGEGSFSRWPGEGRALTMIEQEVIDAILAESGIDLTSGQSRRNLVTTGVRLPQLNGKRFRIGTAILRGVRECAPCGHLERLVGPGIEKAMKGRGGLRADVLAEGWFKVGDAIEVL